MRNVRSAGEYAIVCIGALVTLLPAAMNFDEGSIASWLTVSLLSLLLIVFVGLTLAALRKKDLGYKERTFTYPRGYDAAGPHNLPLGTRRARKVEAINDRIRTWMLEQLERSSSATIFTHDMSWASSTDAEFANDAKEFRVVACMTRQRSRAQLEHLKGIGNTNACSVYMLKLDTSARFTWFTIGTNEIVAVALPHGRRHVIRTTDNPKDPVYRLAKAVLEAASSPKMKLVNLDELDASEFGGAVSE